jgi:hypothetical protein
VNRPADRLPRVQGSPLTVPPPSSGIRSPWRARQSISFPVRRAHRNGGVLKQMAEDAPEKRHGNPRSRAEREIAFESDFGRVDRTIAQQAPFSARSRRICGRLGS